MLSAWADFVDFAGLMMESRDVDPMYPVLRELNRADGLAPQSQRALERSILYVAFYHIVSSERWMEAGGLAAIERDDDPSWPMIGYPTGSERRGLRVRARMREHLEWWYVKSQRETQTGANNGLLAYLTLGFHESDGWNGTRAVVELAPHNGRWASYKMADILAEVHGFRIEAPDAGHRDSTGPLQGLYALLGPMDHEDVPSLDRATDRVRRDLWASGAPVKMSELETLLCNWHALVNGRYYVGHDIDEMLDRVLAAPDAILNRLLDARRRALPEAYLGEVVGWRGVRRELMGLYKRSGLLT